TPLILILDGVTDPHNLGACLRTADAAGVQLVIAPKDKSAPLNATAAKVACGAAEAVPYIQVTNLARTMKDLQQRGIWIVGTAGEAEHSIYQQDMKGPMALVMGAEGSGMRRLTREHCDYLVNIPMAGEVSSVNVSVATGICLFEAVRQRSGVEPAVQAKRSLRLTGDGRSKKIALASPVSRLPSPVSRLPLSDPIASAYTPL